MSSLNSVTLIGNLGRDPDIRTTQAGSKIANLSLATSESWKDKDGTRQERTEWHRCVVFNEGLVGVIERYLRKGSKVYIQGRIETRKWTDQSGAEKYSTEVVLRGFDSKIIMLDGKQTGQESGQSDYGSTGGGGADYSQDLGDEVPF